MKIDNIKGNDRKQLLKDWKELEFRYFREKYEFEEFEELYEIIDKIIEEEK